MKRGWQALGNETPRRTIFVAGCQRSGTNMVMDLLDACRETDVYHEHDPRAFQRYELKDMEVLAALHAASRGRVMVVKTLCDLERLPALCARFAPARVLWIYRDYRDVVNSMLASFRFQSRQIQRLASGQDHSWWGRGLSPASLAVLREHVTPGIDDATAAALQWYVRAGMYFELGHDRNPDACLLNYEALVGDPGAVIAGMCDFLQLNGGAGLAKQVHRQSVGKRRPPPIDPGVAALCNSLQERLHMAHAAQLRSAPRPDVLAMGVYGNA